MEEVKYIPGDLVNIDNDACQVKGVRRRSGVIQNIVEAKVISSSEYIVRAVDECSVEAIPITPAILETNGWKKEYCIGNEDRYIKHNFLHISFYKNDNTISVWVKWLTLLSDVKFVHQLQHLLFGLGLDNILKV